MKIEIVSRKGRLKKVQAKKLKDSEDFKAEQQAKEDASMEMGGANAYTAQPNPMEALYATKNEKRERRDV